MEHLHVRITGTVQGVGFRAWTKRTADERGLIGWVKNCPDGAVEAFFQGSREALAAIQEALGTGPRMARVTRVEVLERGSGLTEHRSFEITGRD
jgi:acylphosphatase